MRKCLKSLDFLGVPGLRFGPGALMADPASKLSAIGIGNRHP